MSDAPATAVRATLLAVHVGGLRPLARQTFLGPYRLDAGDSMRLHSVYLDTADLTLTRYGAMLRLRRQAGHWEATFTPMVRPGGGADDRHAITVPLPRAPQAPFIVPPDSLRVHLAALAAGRALNPILILDVRRRCFDVLAPLAPEGEQPIAQLRLDHVRVSAPDGRQPPAPAPAVYDELTIEGRSEQRRDITRLARRLREGFGLLVAGTSSVVHGLALINRAVPPANPAPPVLVEDTVESAARKIVAKHLGRLRAHDPGTRLGEDAEALHNLRVAVRRLRAVIRALAPGFPAPARQHLIGELQWLGQISTGVRDLDVQLARLEQYRITLPVGHRAGLASLQTYMESERARLRAVLLAGLDSRRYFQLLARLEAFAFTRSRARRQLRDAAAQEPIAQAGARGLKRAWQRLLKRGEKITGPPAPEDLHALRIRAKRLRYLLEFLQELTGKRGRRLVKRLVELQDLLGAYHDAVVTAEFVRQYVGGTGTQLLPADLLMLGAVVNNALQAADGHARDFQRTWCRFSRKRTRREFRALVQQLRALGVRPEQAPQETPLAPADDRRAVSVSTDLALQGETPAIDSSSQNGNSAATLPK